MTSAWPRPGMPVVPEPTPACSKVERLMPLAPAHRMVLSLSVAMAYATPLIAVVTEPGRMAFLEEAELPRLCRPHDDAEARVALLLALGAAPWAEHLVVPWPPLAQVNPQAGKLGPDISKPRH